MAIFHLPQFDHEPFVPYLFKMNDYCAKYVYLTYKKNDKYAILYARA